jgi:hypothetical protein
MSPSGTEQTIQNARCEVWFRRQIGPLVDFVERPSLTQLRHRRTNTFAAQSIIRSLPKACYRFFIAWA